MWAINSETNLVHSLFISFYECCQPLNFFYTQICIQHMDHWGQIQLVQSLLLSFTEYLYNMKGSVMTSVEKSIFSPVSICLFVWQDVTKRNLKLSRNRAVTRLRQTSSKENILQPWEKKEKQEKFITTKWIKRIEIFTKQGLEKT